MDFTGVEGKPHAVFVPYPSQGHITPMMKLAKVIHSKGFHITFVNTEFNHQRLVNSGGSSSSLETGLHDFRFETIPDGLPPSDLGATQHVPSLCASTQKNCAVPFRNLITNKLNDAAAAGVPPVTCVVSDGVMTFGLRVAAELRIPAVAFWTTSACGFMGYLQFDRLKETGLVPLKDVSELSNGYLDVPIDWVAGMKNMRLKDFPSFFRTTDPNDIMLNFMTSEAKSTLKASAIILNTFDDLEREVLEALVRMHPRIYTVGPLPILVRNKIVGSSLASICSNLWTEEAGCLEWLDSREPGSVVYLNFGSVTVMTNQQLIEFAWGLADSNHPFLWIVRPDLVKGDSAVLPEDFLRETKGRGLLASWCSQEQVLSHRAVGAFLTHSGWNSTVESICNGVPMMCWPFFAEQQTNCRYACTEWGVGVEIDGDVKREEVQGLVRELMEGEKGKEERRRALQWKQSAYRAAEPGGSSFVNLDKLVNEVLLSRPSV